MNVIVEDATSNSPTFTLISLFEDHGLRGPDLRNYCLYDHCSPVYKEKKLGGIPFDSSHPQHRTSSQFVPQSTTAVPTLLGNLLFLQKTTKKLSDRGDHFCLLFALFFPWSSLDLPVLSNATWEGIFDSSKDKLCPRLQRHIANLELLHRTNEETNIDRLQRRAPFDDDDSNSGMSDEDTLNFDMELNEVTDSQIQRDQLYAETAETAVEMCNQIGEDFYVREALDASLTNKYFDHDLESTMQLDENQLVYFSTSASRLREAFKSLEAQVGAVVNDDIKLIASVDFRLNITQPRVYLTQEYVNNERIYQIVNQFMLNSEQARAFRIIALHSLGYSEVGMQLLMGVFGEAGTGKSRVITAIRAWFALLDRSKDLVTTAMTGAAAFQIRGSTLHSAVGIPVELGDHTTRKHLKEKKSEWADENRKYLIIDEVSMLDCKVITPCLKSCSDHASA